MKVETWQKIVQPIIFWNFLPNFKRRALPGQWCMSLQQFPNNQVTTQHAISNHYLHTSNIIYKSLITLLHNAEKISSCTYKQTKQNPKLISLWCHSTRKTSRIIKWFLFKALFSSTVTHFATNKFRKIGVKLTINYYTQYIHGQYPSAPIQDLKLLWTPLCMSGDSNYHRELSVHYIWELHQQLHTFTFISLCMYIYIYL